MQCKASSKEKDGGNRFYVFMTLLVLIGLGLSVGIISYKGRDAAVGTGFEEDYELNAMVGFEYTNWNTPGVGNLYIKNIGEEKQLIAKQIGSEQYVYSAISGTLAYVDHTNNLYIAKQGVAAIQISKNVSGDGLSFSKSGKYLFFNSSLDSSQWYFYDIRNNSKGIYTDAEQNNVYIDEDSEDIYYLDASNHLYKKSKSGDKKQIAVNVEEYSVIGKNEVLCRLNSGNPTYVIYHARGQKIQEERIENIDDIDLTRLEGSNKQKLLCFIGHSSSEPNVSHLYVKLKGQEAIKVAENVTSYSYCEEDNSLYYLNSEQILYQLAVPKVNKKYLGNRTYFIRALEECKVAAILENCSYFKSSPNHGNIMARTQDGTLYLCRNNMKFKLASGSLQEDLFNDYVVYRTAKNEIFVQQDINNKELEALEQPILLTDQAQGDYTTSLYGKYLTYACLEGEGNEQKVAIKAYHKATGIVDILGDANTYDKVLVNQLTYIRKLKYDEVVGAYACADYNCLVKMESDGTFRLYRDGIEQVSCMQTYEGYSRASLMVEEGGIIAHLNPYDSYEITTVMTIGTRITLSMNGSCEVNVDGSTTYTLTPITEEVFNQRLEQQKEVEEER